jgi:citrate synthase
MVRLKERLEEKIEAWRPRTTRLLKEFGDRKIGDVTVAQAIGGARGVTCLVTDISNLDPEEGIRFRGYTIPEVLAKLPKPTGRQMPYVEAQVWLLLTGEIPTEEEALDIVDTFRRRSRLPQYVKEVLRALPSDTHPMTLLSAGVLAMQRESVFAKAYEKGLDRMESWKPTYEDALSIMAKLPTLGAYIYRMKYRGDTPIPADPNLDMGANFAHMMGIPDPYDDVARMYFVLHSDHESGNVSAHTGHLVSSALADPYYAISSMLNGLAGPLHGLANQEVLRWIQGVMDRMGGEKPTERQMADFVNETLDSGQVIPGFGHAVLRKTDPRYMAQREFCLEHLSEDPTFEYVNMLFKVVPPILQERGKAKNPWPNVDAQSGVIQWHYGLQEYDFYTVLFGIGRAIGVLSNIIWDRALGYPIERPKSLTTEKLEELVGIS